MSEPRKLKKKKLFQIDPAFRGGLIKRGRYKFTLDPIDDDTIA